MVQLPRLIVTCLCFGLVISAVSMPCTADTRLLRQPSLSAEQVVFTHAGDLWVAGRSGGEARRLTSTAAVEESPCFSPDGRWIAFASNRSGMPAVYVMPVAGGAPTRLTWYPAAAYPVGWTPDGDRVLYASSRQTAPASFERLWTVGRNGGPSQLLPAPWGHNGSYSADATMIVVDRVARWDREWRHYRGGQNTALVILNLDDLSEVRLPNERSIDIHPVWMDGVIYFLSDRDWVMNIWSYEPQSRALEQLTSFPEVDIKWLDGRDGTLVFEHDGWIHTLDIASDRASDRASDTASGETRKLEITVLGDFPWAEPRWEEVTDRIASSSLSATGKRALFEARGEIFSVPVEKGSTRNLSRSSGAADRAPIWSPDGSEVAWFSDSGEGYELVITTQDGLQEHRRLGLGGSKLVWEPCWSPDGSRIALVADKVRVRVIELESGEISTVDVAGVNIERGGMGLAWSPDSRWLAYARTFPNNLRRIVVWSLETGTSTPLTNPLADAVAPSWDRGGRYLYFLASTNLALASGWANTSTMQADPTYAAYAMVLRADDPTPFAPQSDEEPSDEDEEEDGDNGDEAEDEEKNEDKDGDKGKDGDDSSAPEVQIDAEGIERRTLALPMPQARYVTTIVGPEGSVLVGEASSDGPGMTLHKLVLEDREAKVFVTGVSRVSVSADGKKLLYRAGQTWKVVGTDAPPAGDKGTLEASLSMRLDRRAEWRQMFTESWRYERDFFYDPQMHGRDWDQVWQRYSPLLPHVHHRSDLSYLMDQVNGELSVGHSFVFGGDMPKTDTPRVGLLGADLQVHEGSWRIDRIYTFESWNPQVRAPLDRPGLKVEKGHYLLAIDGVELRADDDPYRLLDGTAGRQIVLKVADSPSFEDAWEVSVEPISNEGALRQLAWVEDNRRRVDELSEGKLAYVWVPNTSTRGVVSFNRYFFAQQDRLGAVIDERFNGGGLLDDYMVDLMTRTLRAAVTNEAPDGRPFRLPAGILGPKVLLINELAGSGGDYFPWVFRQQQAGPLIGTRTWGGLVKSSVHYLLVDGGGLTAPDNAVFDPLNRRWIGENEGIPPDIEVLLDARSGAAGRDPQLERGVQEALRLLEDQDAPEVVPPPYPRPAVRSEGR